MTATSNANTIDLADGQSLTVSGNLINSGLIDLDVIAPDIGGSSLSVTGTLINDGTLAIGNAGITAPDTVTVGDLVNVGSLALAGGGPAAVATLNVMTAARSMLTGSISLSGYATLNYAGGGIGSIGSTASLRLDGPNAQISVTGRTGSESALAGLTVNAGLFNLDDGASLSVAVFNNLGDLDLDAGSTAGGSRFSVTGLAMNSGSLMIGNAGVTTPDSVMLGRVINTGAISLDGGSSLSVAGTLSNYGHLAVAADDSITGVGLVNGGTITLQGAQAVLTVTGAGINTGTITTDSGAVLVLAALINNGTVATDGGSITIQGLLNGTGAATIDGGVLTVNRSSPTQTITFVGAAGGELVLDQLSGFAGIVGGLVAGDTIDVAGIAATSGYITSSDNLILTGAANQTVATLRMSGDFSKEELVVTADGHGGSDISVVFPPEVVSSGANLKVLSGKTVGNVTVLSGGTLIVSSGGFAAGATVSGGGIEIVSSGGTATGVNVQGGEIVFAGGTVTGVIASGSEEAVALGVTFSGHTIAKGVTLNVSSGASADDTLIIGTMYVSSGAIATNIEISDGGLSYLDGKMSGVTILSNGLLFTEGTLMGAVVEGVLTQSAGTATDSVIEFGGQEYLTNYGIQYNTHVLSGGQIFVGLGGTISGLTVDDGGSADISVGGSATGASASQNVTVSAGGTYIFTGSGGAGATLDGGTEIIASGGALSGVTVGYEASLVVEGQATSSVVQSGGEIIVQGGDAIGATVQSGGEIVIRGGQASEVTIAKGGEVDIQSSQISGFTISAGGSAIIDAGAVLVDSAGVGANVTVLAGGDFVYAGASARVARWTLTQGRLRRG